MKVLFFKFLFLLNQVDLSSLILTVKIDFLTFVLTSCDDATLVDLHFFFCCLLLHLIPPL